MTDKNLSDAGKMGVTMGVRKIGAPYAVRFSECGSSILRSKRRFRHFSDEKTLDSSEDRQIKGFVSRFGLPSSAFRRNVRFFRGGRIISRIPDDAVLTDAHDEALIFQEIEGADNRRHDE